MTASPSSAPPPSRRLTAAVAALAAAVALAAGWWLGQRQVPGGGGAGDRRLALDGQAALLEQRLRAGQATAAERQRLLELLVALGRRQQAIGVLEPLADREPERWSLRLLLAELRRRQGDAAGAERDLRQILNRQPQTLDALQLWSLLLLERGRGLEAETRVRQQLDQALAQQESRSAGVPLGLLLAELQQRRGTPAAAATTLLALAQGFPEDRRPLLALALLRREQGDRPGGLAALKLARQRGAAVEAADPLLDGLAARWALEPLREPPASAARTR